MQRELMEAHKKRLGVLSGQGRVQSGSMPGFYKDISCDEAFPPDNELAIVAHPANPDILLAGSKDHQAYQNGDRSCSVCLPATSSRPTAACR